MKTIIKRSRSLSGFLLLWLASTMMILWVSSCEEPYTPNTLESQQEYVVEGYVEVGEESNPVFVIVTKSIPFISTIRADEFSKLFVNDAQVSVNDGEKTVSLIPVCLSQIPEELKNEVYAVLGFNPDSTSIDICIYADLFGQVRKKYDNQYDLTVKVGDKVLTATTTVPQPVPLKQFRWAEPPGDPIDTMSRLWVTFEDPKGTPNFYRYLTSQGDQPLIAPFNSVFDDPIFDGMKFEFPLQKAERRGGDLNPDTFGLFKRNESVHIKWCTIDKEHYDFWRTRDSGANRGGPFASYIRISSNIKGGLGIWGGYAVEHYRMTVPPK